MAGFYSSRDWLHIRARQLARQPICQGCEKAPATEVDHVVRISAGGSKRDPTNLQSLCATCHSAKTSAERNGRRWVPERNWGCDPDGFPLDPLHPWNADAKLH